MTFKKLLFAITCTIIIGTLDVDAKAFTLQDNTLKIDIFGNFLKKVGQGTACFTSEVGRIIILDEYEKYFEHRLCKDFP